MSRFITDVKYSLKSVFRHSALVFWIFLFPVILLLLFGFIFGGQGGPVTVYYKDNDGTATSLALLNSLKTTGALDMRDGTGMDLAAQLKSGKISAYLEVPAGFESVVGEAKSGGKTRSAGLALYYDRSKGSSLAVIAIVRESVNTLNLELAGAEEIVSVNPTDVATAGLSYLDFLLPGILGMVILSSAGMAVGAVAQLRTTGVFRKLATTPISSGEWVLARMVTWTVLVIIALIPALFVGWLVFQIHPEITALTILLVIAGSAAFAGLGMIIAGLIRDGDAAINAEMAMIWPLMFVSGSLFPVESMPWFLQYASFISPLTYLNNGLRAAMFSGNSGDALMNLAIIGLFALLFFGIGTRLVSWKED